MAASDVKLAVSHADCGLRSGMSFETLTTKLVIVWCLFYTLFIFYII